MFRWLVRFLISLVFTLAGTILSAQSVVIVIINGRNGRRVAATCVGVWVRQDRKDLISVPTDKNGIARLRLTNNAAEIDTHDRWRSCGPFGVINPVVKYSGIIRVDVSYALCLPRQEYSSLAITGVSTRQLMQKGIVMPNTCGKTSALPKPGELTVFVRKFTWWEKAMR
jgi:hypothetical protein